MTPLTRLRTLCAEMTKAVGELVQDRALDPGFIKAAVWQLQFAIVQHEKTAARQDRFDMDVVEAVQAINEASK